MKVFHSIGIGSFSGKNAEGVYMRSSKQGMSYLRQYQYPIITRNNHNRGEEIKNLTVLWKTVVDGGYITDMEAYAIEYHALPIYGSTGSERAYSPFAIWVKLMYAFRATDPGHIDLRTIALTDLELLFPNCNNIAAQVLDGFLPTTPNSGSYTAIWRS